jgi:hypothetical protein
MEAVQVAIKVYELDTGSFPVNMESLNQQNGMVGWQGPYLHPTNGVAIDPWGTPLRYKYGTNSCELIMAGPDCTFGTKDDKRVMIHRTMYPNSVRRAAG